MDQQYTNGTLASPPGRRLALFGAGGVGQEALEMALRLADELTFAEVIYLDDLRSEPVHGTRIMRPCALGEEDLVCLTVGSPAVRQAMAERCLEREFASLIASTCQISPAAEVAEGAVMFDFAMINRGARVGKHFLSLYYSHVSHDCVLGDYVTFGSHVACNGNVEIGDSAFIGSGAVLKNGSPDRPLRIGARAVVGMGAVVIQDVPEGAVVAGNPAKPIGRKLTAASRHDWRSVPAYLDRHLRS